MLLIDDRLTYPQQLQIIKLTINKHDNILSSLGH